ncbi:hypothetical protein [Blastopirellula marina]|uniref:Uncharacterized protein n=1 Tax=Blastopirellula marina TaxID=124 RepID=A0A2S8GT88_9BACT|nr:hypothetical protein [Blastopirellula marina]PQO47645.1 hypothetical protein C5Y93_03025 [Blastopirellula marina]
MPEPDQNDARPRRRNWLSFRLTTQFLIVTVAAIIVAYPQLHRRWLFHQFTAYVDQDLRELSNEKQEAFGELAKNLLPEEEIEFGHSPENWFVWKVSTDNGERYVLFRGVPTRSIPDTCGAKLDLFNKHGFLVGRSSFYTGWRSDISDAALELDRLPGETLVRIHSVGAKHYYAFIDDEVALLRLEDYKGNQVPNDYHYPNMTIGPWPSLQTEQEWIDALNSSRPAVVLQALTWFAGEHRPADEPDQNFEMESLENAQHVAHVRSNPEAKAAVVRLLDHPIPWIADGARFALPRFEEASDKIKKAGSIP